MNARNTLPNRSAPVEGVTVANTHHTPGIARGEEYRKIYQSFTRDNTLVALETNHAILKRLVFLGSANRFAYGIGCFRCGEISWNPEDVNARYCSKCRIYHNAS